MTCRLSYVQFKWLPKKELTIVCINILGISLVIDVVCGMEIDEKNSKWKSEFKGKTYYFCGPMCKIEFDENPEKYMSDARDSLNK